jgi:hypothetical protein
VVFVVVFTMTYTFWLGAEGDVKVDSSYERYAVSVQVWRDFSYVGYVPTWAENAKQVDHERRFHTYSQIKAKLDKL